MARGKLELGENFFLPIDAVTGSSAFVGNKGMGKTNAMVRLAEQAIRAGQQVVTLDPTDAHYGLKYGRSKGEEGLPVYVLGGSHGDQDLDPNAGGLMAEVVVESRANFVLSLRRMSKTAMRSFVAAFLTRLYELKGDEANRNPLLVVMDEAHLFAPEGAAKDALTCLGAVQDVALLGRSSGLGVAMGTQRTAALSKSVLDVCELLVCFRATGANTRKKLKEWVSEQEAETGEEEFFATVSKLDVGEAIVWSPGWLRVFERVKFLQRETFDSSATPRPGQRLRPKGKAKAVDLDALGVKMSEMSERQAANDPGKLRGRIRELERERDEWGKAVAARDAEIERLNDEVRVEPVEVPALADGEIDDLARLLREWGVLYERGEQLIEASGATIAPLIAGLTKVVDARKTPAVVTSPRPLMTEEEKRRGWAEHVGLEPIPPDPETTSTLGLAERKVLTALIQFPGASKQKVGLLTGYSTKASTIPNALAELRRLGYVERGSTQPTATGFAVMPHIDPPPEGPELLDFWRARVGAAERKVVDVLVKTYPNRIGKEDVAEATGYSVEASTIPNALAELRRAGIVERGALKLDDEFAEAIR